MEDTGQLGNSLRQLRLRVRLLIVERFALFGLCIGATAAAVIVLFSYSYDSLLDYRLWAAVLLLGAVAGAVWGLTRRIDDLSVALAADKRTNLRERLSTAVALGASGDTPDMVRALIADAGRRASEFAPGQVFRHRFGRPHIAGGCAMLFLIGAIFIPQMPALQSKDRKAEVAVMKTEGAKIAKLADELKKRTDPKYGELRGLADRLQKLGWKMQTGRLPKKQAILEAQRLSKSIQQEQDRLARDNSKKSMEQARAEMQKASAELAKRMAEQMAENENIPPEEAMKKLPSDQRMAELARKEEALTAAEQQELEQAVEKYANPGSSAPVPAELSEALAKLAANGDYQKAAELMRKLSRKLKSGKMKPMDAEALKKQLEALAKALKDTDLDKLARQMLENAEKLANMSLEELRKMLDEMEKMQQMAQACQKAGAG